MRDPEYLAELRTALVYCFDDESPEYQLRCTLEDHLDDFRKLFDYPNKSPEARQKIESGKATIDGVEYSINKDFVDAALRLSDFLEIDEMLAAEYLYSGTENALRFDREPFECALYLYHTVHCILLDTFRIIMSYAIDETMHRDARAVLQKFLGMVVGENAESFPNKCLKLLDQIEKQSQGLENSEKRDRLLGSGLIQSDHSFIATSLYEEHESVSLCLAALCRLRPDASSHLLKMIQDLKQVDTWTSFVSNEVMIVIQSIQALALADDLQVSLIPNDIDKLGPIFRSIIESIGIRSTDEWRCVAICSILQILLATELNGLCKEHEDIALQFDYEQELLVMARQAIEKNVFQNLITFSLFVRNEVNTLHPFSVFFSSDALSHYQATKYQSQSGLLTAAIDDCNRNFTQSFIMHMADLLKEMHLKAEDSLSIQEVSEVGQGEDEYHQEDMFFGLIFTAFDRGHDLGFVFWDDKESDLYGFLVWASHAQVPSAIYSYFKMIGALSNGPRSASAASRFFDQSADDTAQSDRSSPSFTVSWDFIFDSLRYYIRHLDHRQGSTSFTDPLEIDLHNALVLDAYLTSLYKVLWNLSDVDSVFAIHSKFDASTVLFQLLACRLPSELYASIFCLLSAFARCVELRNVLWQQLESWLAAVQVGTDTSMLASTVRRKRLEHRPLNCLTTFSETAPDSIVSLVELLTALVSSDPANFGSLPFPESLGDSSRYHGITDYVDFVLNILLAAQSDSSVFLLKRLDISSACAKFLQKSIRTLDLDLIHLFRSGYSSIDADIKASSLQQYLLLHPGTYVLQRLGESQVREAIMAIIKSHDAVDLAIKERLTPIVVLALDVCCGALERMDTFDEFVRPQLSNKQTDATTFANEILTDSDLFIHICLLSNSLDFECSCKALDLMHTIGQLSLPSARRRFLAALTSVDQSKGILSGFIHLIEQRDDIFKNRKLQLLRFLVFDLETAQQPKSDPSIAHFLLGLKIETDYTITEGGSSGEIGSGRSLLHSLLDLVDSGDDFSSERVMDSFPELCTIASHVILLLCEDSLASTVAMRCLQSHNYLTMRLQREKLLQDPPRVMPVSSDISSLTNRTLEFSILRRADLLRYCSKELLACKSVQAASLLKDYILFLVSSQDDSNRYDVLLLDYLDILHLARPTKSAKPQWQYFPADLLHTLLLDLTPAGLLRLQLALDLILKKRTASADTTLRDAITKEYERVLVYLADVIEKTRLRMAVSLCLEEWKSMAIVMFDILDSMQHPARSSIAGDVAQRLLITLPEIQETDSDLADVLTEAVVGTANLLTSDAMNLDSCNQFFKRVVSSLESPSSTQVQREHLYLTGVTCLRCFSHIKSSRTTGVTISKTGSDRLLTITCQDIIATNETLQISACVFLDLLLQECEDQSNPWLSNNIVRLNLVDRFLHHFEAALNSSESSETVGSQYDLLLRLSMTRAGAREISRKDNMLKLLAQKYLNFDDGQEDTSNAIRLLSIYISCGIALGVHNDRQFLVTFVQEWRDKLAGHSRRMSKVKNKDSSTFQVLLDIIDELRAENQASDRDP